MKNSMAILLRSTAILAGHSTTPRETALSKDSLEIDVHSNKHIVDELSDEEWVD